MRIQEVVKRTNLQKRTIYFYIKEQLITPASNQENGYHDFSEDDVSRLIMIRKLRDADLPLADIRSILSNPEQLLTISISSFISFRRSCLLPKKQSKVWMNFRPHFRSVTPLSNFLSIWQELNLNQTSANITHNILHVMQD